MSPGTETPCIDVPTTRRGTATARLSEAAKVTLTAQIHHAVTRGDAPAIVELVVNAEGVLYEDACGLPTDAIFYIGSMTKPVTSVAIMMLAEQGRLTIDTPVSRFLDGYDQLQVITKFNAAEGTWETRPAKTVMTIRHLLSHTSGIGYGWSNPIANALIAKTKKNEWELPLLHDPGARFTYSAGPRVLGFIIEKLTGCDLESWYQEHIFKPLGMFDTSYVVATDKRRRLAPLFTRVSGKIEPLAGKSVQTPTTGLMRGDGGLYSTAGDYGRFLRMLLNGGALDGRRILRESSVTQMSQNAIGDLHVELQPDADPRFTRPFPRGAGKDKFGLGFQIAAAMDGVRSPGTISWAGLYNTQFWVDPEKQFGAVHMMQLLPFYDDGALRALRGFEQAIYDNVRLA